jgi:hypothetical protein
MIKQTILKTSVILLLILPFTANGYSQSLEVIKSSSVKVEELPEYVIITSQNTKLLGGIGIIIDYKKSIYKEQLRTLEELLQDGDKLRIRNQTDLLNAMSQLGYEYINAYNADQVVPAKDGDDVGEVLNIVGGGEGTFRINMVFRKKPQFRK